MPVARKPFVPRKRYYTILTQVLLSHMSGNIVSADLHSPVIFVFPAISIIGTVRKIRASRVIWCRKAVSTSLVCNSTAGLYEGLHL
jgi:hypothetical protein